MMNQITDKGNKKINKAYYLTALVYQGEGKDNKFKYSEKYPSYASVKTRLKQIVDKKRQQKWIVKADFKSKPPGNGNVEYMVTGTDPQSSDKVHWLISAEPHVRMAGGNEYPEFEDVTPKQRFQQQEETSSENSSVIKKIFNNKLPAIITICLSGALFWIFFV